MTDSTTYSDPLAALGAHLGARGLAVELTARGLRVTNPDVAGCCDESKHPTDTITCRPREGVGGQRWFFTSWGAPIAEANQITEAALTVCSALSRQGVSWVAR